jgi:mRNA interferase RelE/StbE
VPTWRVELTPEAQTDFNRLDGSVRKQVLKQLVKLELNPRYGNPLGNRAGINLEGYFKLYADKKRIRIIYEEIENIIKVIAIDKREDLEVYQLALKRILSMKPDSQ